MDIYREQILDHYKHPRNFGHLKKPEITLEKSNVTCGDRITIEIKLEARNPKPETRIQDIRFHGEGCVISQASASMLTEKVKSMKLDDVRKLNAKDITDMLGTTLTPTRMKCAVLPLEVLHQAIGSVSWNPL